MAEEWDNCEACKVGCNDTNRCCFSFWCPCVAYGRIKDKLDGTDNCVLWGLLYMAMVLFTGCQCCLTCANRAQLRRQKNQPGNDCGDCCCHWLCDAAMQSHEMIVLDIQ